MYNTNSKVSDEKKPQIYKEMVIKVYNENI